MNAKRQLCEQNAGSPVLLTVFMEIRSSLHALMMLIVKLLIHADMGGVIWGDFN